MKKSKNSEKLKLNQIANNVLEIIGHTPLVRLNQVSKGIASELIVKCEFLNPGGSVKDRIGIAMIEDAEKRGVLKPGGTIVESTSGNTGVGLAIAATLRGYKCVFVLPDKMSLEKIKNLRSFGARVVVTPTAVAPDDPRSYYMVSRRIAQETPNSLYINQYDNLSNREAHFKTTGPEIWEQTGGLIDAFVAGMGTCGTIIGTAMYLKKKNKKIKIIGVDPVGSILHDYFHTKKMIQPHTYKIEGIGEDFIPKNYDSKFLDETIQITDKEAYQMTRKLLLQEGLYTGVSSGAAVVGAIKYAQRFNQKKRIVVLLPDSGNRYLSKVYDDDWMRENGFLEDSLGTVRDLIVAVKPPTREAIITATAQDEVGKIIYLMRDKGISQIPVMKKREIVGIVSENNLLSALFTGKLKNTDQIASIVENTFVIVSIEDEVEHLSQSLASSQTPIVVENGEIQAIITKIDIISYLGNRKKP